MKSCSNRFFNLLWVLFFLFITNFVSASLPPPAAKLRVTDVARINSAKAVGAGWSYEGLVKDFKKKRRVKIDIYQYNYREPEFNNMRHSATNQIIFPQAVIIRMTLYEGRKAGSVREEVFLEGVSYTSPEEIYIST